MARRVGLDRTQVLDTAAKLADERAPESLTLQALADALGIQKPSLYNYVDGLPGLERELALRAGRLMAEQFAEATVGKTRDKAAEALAFSFRRFILEHPGLYALSVQGFSRRDPPDEELRAMEAKVLHIVAAVMRSYELEGDALTHAIRGLRSLVHGFATLEAAGGFGMPLSIEESFQRLVKIFLRGLRGQA